MGRATCESCHSALLIQGSREAIASISMQKMLLVRHAIFRSLPVKKRRKPSGIGLLLAIKKRPMTKDGGKSTLRSKKGTFVWEKTWFLNMPVLMARLITPQWVRRFSLMKDGVIELTKVQELVVRRHSHLAV